MKCCGKNRTNYKDVLGGRFLPPPIPFEKTQRGIYPADVDNKTAKYGSLFHRLALKELEPVSDYQQLPFPKVICICLRIVVILRVLCLVGFFRLLIRT